MTGEALTCPYCNARVHAGAAVGPSGRVTCPRCGEAFAAAGAAGPAPTPEAAPPELLQAAPPNWPGRLAGLSAVALVVSLLLRVVLTGSTAAEKAFPFMVGLASLGGVAAVWLWYFGRRRR